VTRARARVAPRLARGILLAAAVLAAASPAAPELFAGRLDATNLALRPGGPDAIGGLDDWALSNGVVCAVVTDPAHESDLSTRGGVLVDAGHCGRDDDQFVLLQPLVNLAREGALAIGEVRAESDPAEARLVASGAADGLRLEVGYAVDGATPERIRVRTRLERTGEGGRAFGLALLVLHAERALRPFALSTGSLAGSPGFHHPATDSRSFLSAARAVGTSDLFVLVGAEGLEPGIAYGHRLVSAAREDREGRQTPLPRFSLAEEGYSALAAFARPFWIGGGGGLGPLELAQTRLMDLAPGAAIVLESELSLGGRPDVASVADRVFADGALVTGRVSDPAARIGFAPEAGGAASDVRPGAEGRFELRLPAGRYALTVRAPGGRGLERTVAVEGGALDLGLLAVGEPAWLELPRGAPMRLVVRGEGGTPDPVFREDLLDFRVGERTPPTSVSSNDLHLAGSDRDPARVAIAPGRYRVLATRGPEFEVRELRVEIAAGQTARLAIPPLERAFANPGWIAADLHVHAAPSDDSAVPLELRLASYVAQGARVLVATDHDHVTDYAPLIERWGLGREIVSVTGVEVTSSVKSADVPFTMGHANAFPIPYQPDAYRKGAPVHEGRRLRDVLGEIRAPEGERVVQLNHPRPERTPSPNQFFTHLGVAGEPFDPELPLGAWPNRVLIEPDPESERRDLDFDAIELLNGPSLERYRAVREDWFALLRQGERLTGTANSDSHLLLEVAAVPRTYVRMLDDLGRGFDQDRFVRALQRGWSFGSTGPMLLAEVGDTGQGGTFPGNEAPLRIEVRAAPWVPVAELRVFTNGELVVTRALEGPVRLEIPMRFERDCFVTVEVEGPPGGLYAELLPGFTPFAFSNPIFVDADRDGVWSPPGLPGEATR
jgi:hypothetical protein